MRILGLLYLIAKLLGYLLVGRRGRIGWSLARRFGGKAVGRALLGRLFR